jgi:DNA-binding NtrC family response regulator
MMTTNPKRRVLVVDSDPSMREFLRCVLASDGHQVDEAQSGSQAVEKLDHGNFDVVLSGAAELDVKSELPFPALEVRGEATPVLKMNDDPRRDATEEIINFMFNPFDLASIRQALSAIDLFLGLGHQAASVESLSAA